MKQWYRFGRFEQGEALSAETVRGIIDEGKSLTRAQAETPVEELVEVLEECGRRLSDPGCGLREEALERLPGVVGFTRPMVEAGLDALCGMLEGKNLLGRLDIDLGDARFLDQHWYNQRFQGYLRAHPRGLAAHVAAGNVFVGAVDTLVQGIVTKNINILKMAGADPVFPMLFARLVCECDPGGVVSRSFALLPFRGGRADVEELIKTQCDLVIVYGGDDAVEAYRQGLGRRTRLVEYGPKYSFYAMEQKELERRGLGKVARQAARDITMWEQSACSSPHAVYLAAGQGEQARQAARELAEALAAELEGWLEDYPHGEIYVDEKVEITRERELARVRQALGQSELFTPGRPGQDWTVILDYEPVFRVSPHHRTVFVKPVPRLEDIPPAVEAYGPFLQSVGLVAARQDAVGLVRELAALGADRFTEPDWMSRRKHGTPHDGGRGAAEMVRWTSVGDRRPFQEDFDYWPDEKRDRLTLCRVNRLIAFCREKSPFYQGRLPEKRLGSLDELSRLPVLGQKEFRAHLPPSGRGILTAPLEHSYAFGSGGTTGAPKFIYRTVEETLFNARTLAKGLYNAAFRPGDVVANLLYAGNMWASFVSFNQALEQVGCHILPVAGSIDIEQIVLYLRTFRPTGAVSIPSVFLTLARYAEENGITDIRLPKIASGGEHLFPEAMDYLTRILGTEKFASPGYTTNDTGAVAIPCEQSAGGLHHIAEELHYVEIVDPDTNEPLPHGEEGKVLVTNLQRRLMPMIRYDVGDMGRILIERCPCGRTVRLFELRGRSDEVLKIGASMVYPEMAAQAIGQVEGLSYHFRLLARREGMQDLLVLEVEAKKGMPEQERRGLADRLWEALVKNKAEFRKAVETGTVARPVVDVLPPQSLPRNPRTGKIRQVEDQRLD